MTTIKVVYSELYFEHQDQEYFVLSKASKLEWKILQIELYKSVS